MIGVRLLAVFGLAMASVPAWAVPSTDSVSIDIKARVAERCGIKAGKHANKPLRIDQAQSFALGFDLDCNTPFRIGISSERGAMRLTTAPDGATDLDGFSIEKPYTIALSMATDSLGNVDAGSCTSRDLLDQQGACPFYGHPRGHTGFSPGDHETAIQRQGQILISWAGDDGAAPRRLAAGDYQDILTVEVAPLV
jgi:hypothetical protein